MGKSNCINRSLKTFKKLKADVSKALGLTDVLITDESLLDVIDLFAAENNVNQDKVLGMLDELSEYIEDYFGIGTKYTPDEDVKDAYDEWFNDNIEYINKPYDITNETEEFENEAKIVTEDVAKIITLDNGQKMTIIPNGKKKANEVKSYITFTTS